MDLVDSADQKVVPAVFRSIMGALVPLYAPVAREQGRHTGAARAGDVKQCLISIIKRTRNKIQNLKVLQSKKVKLVAARSGPSLTRMDSLLVK